MDTRLFSLFNFLLTLFLSYLLYFVGQIIHRLYFHDLAHFPGPKHAAVSYLPELYQKIKGRTFEELIGKYHDRYGPIVRISPTELHIRDPLYAPIFHQNGKRYTSASNNTLAKHFFIIETPMRAEKQLSLQEALSDITLEDFVETAACKLVLNMKNQGEVVDISKLIATMTGQIFLEHFSASEYDRLEFPDLGATFHGALEGNTGFLDRHATWISKMIGLLACKKSISRKDDVQNVMGVGLVTTATVLITALRYIAQKPRTMQRLQTELLNALPEEETLTWPDLKGLPYLTGCVKEAIRLSRVSRARTPRVSNNPTIYKTWTVPAGTPIAMNYTDISLGKEIFAKPMEFKPERWSEDDVGLDKFFLGFGRNFSHCIGFQIAELVLYSAIAKVFRFVSLEPVDEYDPRDCASFLKPGMQGTRFKCTPLIKRM